MPDRGEDRQHPPADQRKGVGRAGGDPYRRCRFLVRLGDDGDVIETMVDAVVGEGRFGPGALYYVENFAKPRLALGVGNTVGRIGLRDAAATDAKDQPAVAQLIDRGGLLGEPQRVAERQDLHRDPDLDPAGARGDRAGDAERRRQAPIGAARNGVRRATSRRAPSARRRRPVPSPRRRPRSRTARAATETRETCRIRTVQPRAAEFAPSVQPFRSRRLGRGYDAPVRGSNAGVERGAGHRFSTAAYQLNCCAVSGVLPDSCAPARGLGCSEAFCSGCC